MSEYPKVGKTLVVDIHGHIYYLGHVMVSLWRGIYASPCWTEDQAEKAAQLLLDDLQKGKIK